MDSNIFRKTLNFTTETIQEALDENMLPELKIKSAINRQTNA